MRLAESVRLETRPQVLEDVAALLPTGGHDGQHSLNEPAPVDAVGSTADFTPDHRMSHGSLCRVIGRLDPLNSGKGPQPFFHFEDLEAGCRCLGAPTRRSFLEDLLDLAPQSAHWLLKGRHFTVPSRT